MYQLIFCPNCEPVYRRSKPDERCGVCMTEVVHNYSGCGVDHYHCPECEQLFQVSYKVDKIILIN